MPESTRSAIEGSRPGCGAVSDAELAERDYLATGGRARLDDAARALEVHNDGEPIAPDVAPNLFTPFRRGDSQQGSGRHNVGLDLYISRQIALAHGGTIAVDSAATGTTVVVELPRVRAAAGR